MNIQLDTIRPADDCFGKVPGRTMLSFSEAVASAIASAVLIDGLETVPLLRAAGRILATDIIAPASLPRFDHSAMDGYAVRCADFDGPGPWILDIVASVAAGEAMTAQHAGFRNAVGINTGAPIPDGFDAVVTQERCAPVGVARILISALPHPGANIRRRGEDVSAGSCILPAGTEISPHHAALLAALGMRDVPVRPRIRVAYLATGTELRRPGEPLEPAQIYDSNCFLVQAVLMKPWAEVHDLGCVPDTLEAAIRLLEKAAYGFDVVVSSGGMSHGPKDFMRAALEACDARLSFLNVKMRPGKPATFGRLGDALFIGLPGNPMAAAVALTQIAMPAIRRTAGIAKVGSDWQVGIADFDHRKRIGLSEFVPVRFCSLSGDLVPRLELLGVGSSGSLLPLAQADGLACLGPDIEQVEPGSTIPFVRFWS